MNGLVLRHDIGAIAILTLNRPEKLNALSPELFLDLRTHIDAISGQNDQIACVILKGAGRSFCSGADMEALKAGIVMADPEFRSETIERLGRMPQAVIASVHGHCYTGGLELALAADIIIAAENSRFCDTHAKLGIIPRWGLSARLPRRVGLAAARKISIFGEPIDAAEAHHMCLCDYVAPVESLDDFTMARARMIAAQSAPSIAAIKHLYSRCNDLSLDEALAYERSYTKAAKETRGDSI